MCGSLLQFRLSLAPYGGGAGSERATGAIALWTALEPFASNIASSSAFRLASLAEPTTSEFQRTEEPVEHPWRQPTPEAVDFSIASLPAIQGHLPEGVVPQGVRLVR